MKISGKYYFSNSPKFVEASIEISKSEIKIISLVGKVIFETSKDLVKDSYSILGASSKLDFYDGSSFIPDDPSIRWNWNTNSSKFAEKLSKNFKFIISIFVVIPLFIWLVTFQAMPRLSYNIAKEVSDESKALISENLISYLIKEDLQESDIDLNEKKSLENYFYTSLEKLNISQDKYELLFYKSDTFGANALALPDGKIILTDQLYSRLIDKPDAVLAILLHEVGHVEENHGLRQIIQSLGVGLIFILITGDVQGLSETLVGSSFILIQQSFSRTMETEADVFSINSLKRLGISTDEFVIAMEAIIDSNESDSWEEKIYFKYLSSHPGLKDRIEMIKEN